MSMNLSSVIVYENTIPRPLVLTQESPPLRLVQVHSGSCENRCYGNSCPIYLSPKDSVKSNGDKSK